jgi:hypothetical protein
MVATLRGLLRLDLGAIDVRKGVMGLGAILAFGIFVALFGNVGMVAALAVLFVVLADQPGSLRDHGLGVLVFTLAGTLIALIGVWAGSEHIVVSTALTFSVVLPATLAAGFGAPMYIRGLLLSIWAVVAISLAGDQADAFRLAVAFAGGGLIAAAIIWLRTRAMPEPTVESEAIAAVRTLESVVRSPLGWFSVLRAAATAVALWIGASLFALHPIWAALTVILVMKPKPGETVGAGLMRSIGTILGVLVAELLIALTDGDRTAVFIGFMLTAFAMAALQKVNYAVFVACLTTLLVLSDQLAAGTGEATAMDRLLATLLGAAIAFAAIAIGRALLGRPVMGGGTDPPAVGEDQTPG